MLALRGSGQGMYVGFAEDLFIVASEPYGMVEETARYFTTERNWTDGTVPGREGTHDLCDAAATGQLTAASVAARNSQLSVSAAQRPWLPHPCKRGQAAAK